MSIVNERLVGDSSLFIFELLWNTFTQSQHTAQLIRWSEWKKKLRRKNMFLGFYSNMQISFLMYLLLSVHIPRTYLDCLLIWRERISARIVDCFRNGRCRWMTIDFRMVSGFTRQITHSNHAIFDSLTQLRRTTIINRCLRHLTNQDLHGFEWTWSSNKNTDARDFAENWSFWNAERFTLRESHLRSICSTTRLTWFNYVFISQKAKWQWARLRSIPINYTADYCSVALFVRSAHSFG